MTDQTPTITINLAPGPETLRHIEEGIAHAARLLARVDPVRAAARAALTACLSRDDDNAALTLAGLDDEQLEKVENAAVALSLHTSRLRTPDGETLDEPIAELRDQIIQAMNEAYDKVIGDFPIGEAANRIMPLIGAALTAQRDEAREQQQRADQLNNDLAHARSAGASYRRRAQRAEADAADWRTVANKADGRLIELRRLANQMDYVRASDIRRIINSQDATQTLHNIIAEQPDTFRAWLRDEIRRDPEWWRDILRRELRLGYLRDDFRRAGLA